MAATAVVGLRMATWVNVVFTSIEVGGLLLVVGLAGTSSEVGGAWTALATAPTAGALAGAALVFFAYLGFEDLANLVEEVREPRRMLVLGALSSMLLVSQFSVAVVLAGAIASAAALTLAITFHRWSGRRPPLIRGA